MRKVYSIYLGDYKLGTTYLEKADAPMGVVFGSIEFNDSGIGYKFIKDYCKKRQIELVADYPYKKLLSTRTIDELKIVNEKGIIIEGIGNQIDGMDSDGYEITIEGIPYPFYEEEFPHHVKEYENLFKDKK